MHLMARRPPQGGRLEPCDQAAFNASKTCFNSTVGEESDLRRWSRAARRSPAPCWEWSAASDGRAPSPERAANCHAPRQWCVRRRRTAGPDFLIVIGQHARHRILEAFAAGRRNVIGPAPDMDLILAPFLAGFVLVEAGQVAIVALVERLVPGDGKRGLAEFGRGSASWCSGRGSGSEVKPVSKLRPSALRRLAGGFRLAGRPVRSNPGLSSR